MTKYHKLRDLKQPKVIILEFHRSEVQHGLTGLKSRFQPGCIPSRGSRENSFPAFSSSQRLSEFLGWLLPFSIVKDGSIASSDLFLTTAREGYPLLKTHVIW